MPLNETVNLNITEAQRQISVLEGQLDQLSRPITVPVNVQGGGELDNIRRDLDGSEGAVADLNRELGQTDDALRGVASDARRTGDDLERSGRRGASAFDGLGRSLIGFTAALGGLAAIRGAFAFAGEAITAASNLEQSLGALDAVFGDLGDEVAAFGETADQSVGLAASQFNQLASVLGAQLQTFGFNVADAATETQRLIVLASDLAATFGGPVSQSVEAISSLLRGEVNPIERYGVAMNEAAVQARALEDGLAATASELTFQDKTMARLAILYDQTANAQGQFGREADTTAGQLERLNAQVENARAAIGEAFNPALQVLLDIAPSVVSAIETSLVPAFAALAASMDDVDTSGFIANISGLPFAIESVVSQVGAGAQTFGNALQLFNDLLTFNFEGIGENFRQLGDDIQRFSEIPIANQAIQNMITTLAGGAAPVAAFEAVLVELGQEVSALDPETFEELATQLLAMAEAAGADPGDLKALAEDILVLGEDAGFSAVGVQILVDLLMGPWGQAMAEASSGDIIIGNLARSMAEAGDAAQQAAPLISGFGGELDGLPDGADAFRGIVDNIESEFNRLPGIFNVVADALETAEGEAITKAQDFLDNIREEFEAQRLFEDNIEAARALGLDNLVDAAEQFGIEFAPVLADALANPTLAREIDTEFDGFMAERAQNAYQALATALLAEFASAPLEVVLDVDVVLGNVRLPGAGNLFENISIPSTGSLDDTGSGGTGGSGANVFSVVNEFTGFTPTSTDLAKASMITSSIIKSNVT